MIIKTKGIVHERVEDAPFMGALICAVDCKFNCKGCFNQHLKNLPTIEMDSEEILDEVIKNPFNEGIILAGLEWSLQPNELRELVNSAINKELKVIIYSGLNEEEFKLKFPDLYSLKNIYFKFGRYEEGLKVENNIYYDVKLATSNQKIVKR
ncbi:4Fe-4S cluster-binding domain-containing protein [Clostridium sp. Ade.TY]|uniref:4Fe-4S cluster-binding domain-containing protein n=1 Tax=Clostridium sp. Ade.TY TaxID=1391647 RepID=UPI00041B1766|nr:4Fe-4S cluster-binding domain-containing protein [Clostridium sp. Ade.TY]